MSASIMAVKATVTGVMHEVDFTMAYLKMRTMFIGDQGIH